MKLFGLIIEAVIEEFSLKEIIIYSNSSGLNQIVAEGDGLKILLGSWGYEDRKCRSSGKG